MQEVIQTLQVTCPYCGYKWLRRTLGHLPVECPRCKRYLNRPPNRRKIKRTGAPTGTPNPTSAGHPHSGGDPQ